MKAKKLKVKKHSMQCPICGKSEETSDELLGWTKPISKKLAGKLKELDDKINWMVEFFNHDKNIGNITKRTSLLYATVDKLVGCTLTNNYFRFGLLLNLIFKINRKTELNQIESFLDGLENQLNKKDKRKFSQYAV